MKKILLIASVLMVLGASVNAQVSENPVATSASSAEGGAPVSEGAKENSAAVYARYQFNNAYYKGDSEPFRNFGVGVHLFKLSNKVIEVGLELSYFSQSTEQEVAGAKMKSTTDMWRLSMPYRVGYRFGAGRNCQLFPYVTFAFAWNFAGSMKVKAGGHAKSYSIFSINHMPSGSRYENFSVPLGVGLKAYVDKFLIGVEYTWDEVLQSDYTHSGPAVSVGYIF